MGGLEIIDMRSNSNLWLRRISIGMFDAGRERRLHEWVSMLSDERRVEVNEKAPRSQTQRQM